MLGEIHSADLSIQEDRGGHLRPANRDLSLGVEEEFFLVDLEDGSPVPWADKLCASMPTALEGRVVGELYPCAVEIATPICHDLDDLKSSLTKLRTETAARASKLGIGLLASSTHPDLPRERMLPRNVSRYQRQSSEYRHLIVEQQVVGCHIHVGLGEDDVIPVMDRVRSLLSPLIALSANSPFWEGADTGYASWRTMVWSNWPVSGSPPELKTRAGYESIVADLVSMGAVSDASNVYWDLRPSLRYPTLEFRAFDVGRTVEEVVVLSALVRACVRMALEEKTWGIPSDEVSSQLLQAARWQAARDGLSGLLVDVVDRQLKPSAVVLRGLLEKLRPALEEEGFWEEAWYSVQRALRGASGEQRQKLAFSRRGLLLDVVRDSTIHASKGPAALDAGSIA
ncbi:MAG: carboxylate-amine ligase [Actinomycetota bacterium]